MQCKISAPGLAPEKKCPGQMSSLPLWGSACIGLRPAHRPYPELVVMFLFCLTFFTSLSSSFDSIGGISFRSNSTCRCVNIFVTIALVEPRWGSVPLMTALDPSLAVICSSSPLVVLFAFPSLDAFQLKLSRSQEGR